MNNWVILFVRTTAEAKVARALEAILNGDEFLPFLPTKEMPRRNKGVITKVRKVLFPGYVFIKTNIETDQIADKLKSAFTSVGWHEDIYRVLHYGGDKKDVAMREPERSYWERLFGPDFCVAGSVGIIEGDKLRVMSGPLVGMEGLVKKINRHKREAIVELNIMGAIRKVKLMLEVTEKVK